MIPKACPLGNVLPHCGYEISLPVVDAVVVDAVVDLAPTVDEAPSIATATAAATTSDRAPRNRTGRNVMTGPPRTSCRADPRRRRARSVDRIPMSPGSCADPTRYRRRCSLLYRD